MNDITGGEVITTVFVCLGVVGGALFGWMAAGTVVATVGGAVIFGLAALLLAALVGFAVDGIAHLLRGRDDR